jgi:hypothetical protein
MTVVLSRRDIDRFTPPGHEAEEKPPVYLIAPLTWRERAAFRAELARLGVPPAYPVDAQLVGAVRDAVEELAPDNATELLASIDAFKAILDDPLPTPSAEEGSEERAEQQRTFDEGLEARRPMLEAYQAILDAMRRHPKVAGVLADRTMFFEVAPTLAAAYALRGWENVDVPFARKNGVVDDAALDALPRGDLIAAGLRALALQSPGGAERKN